MTYQPNNTPRSLRWLLVPIALLASVVAVFVGVSLYLHGGPPQPYYGGWYWFPFGGLLFIPVFLLAFFAFRFFWWGAWGWGGNRNPGWYDYEEDLATETIRQRYARGEITKDQFEQLKRDIQYRRGATG